eukprot:487701-Hanusia_phi.AAC.1
MQLLRLTTGTCQPVAVTQAPGWSLHSDSSVEMIISDFVPNRSAAAKFPVTGGSSCVFSE